MSNGCVRSIWKSAWSTYGERYVNISCGYPCHQHIIIVGVLASREPGPALASHRRGPGGVRSGKGGLIPGRTPALPGCRAPPPPPRASVHSLSKVSGRQLRCSVPRFLQGSREDSIRSSRTVSVTGVSGMVRGNLRGRRLAPSRYASMATPGVGGVWDTGVPGRRGRNEKGTRAGPGQGASPDGHQWVCSTWGARTCHVPGPGGRKINLGDAWTGQMEGGTGRWGTSAGISARVALSVSPGALPGRSCGSASRPLLSAPDLFSPPSPTPPQPLTEPRVPLFGAPDDIRCSVCVPRAPPGFCFRPGREPALWVLTLSAPPRPWTLSVSREPGQAYRACSPPRL